MRVAGLCEALHVLPEPGGLLDQDPYWIDRITLYLEVKSAVEAERQKEQSGRPV
jgi:hypothetical protein